MTSNQAFIELALENNVLKFGDFTLKSGRKSPYFFNAGEFKTGHAIDHLGRFYAQTIARSGLEFDMIFGPAYKGITLAAATAIALDRDFGINVPFAFNRKEAKDHGEGGSIIGAKLQGRVLVLDDVLTAGTAFREALAIIEQHGATCAGLCLAINRQECGQGEQSAIEEIQATHQIPVYSIITLSDLIEFVGEKAEFSPHLEAMKQYRDNYGV